MLKYSYSLGVLLFCSTLETAIKGVANGKIRDAETLVWESEPKTLQVFRNSEPETLGFWNEQKNPRLRDDEKKIRDDEIMSKKNPGHRDAK